MRRTRSLCERYENHAIYDTPSPRRKPKPKLTASQVPTFDYVAGILQAKWNRMRKTR
ncbi:MAG TPA: NinE family protein [Pantoea sp.]|nr:NinE family protein [Pantoea sp. FDAARGOS_194]HAK35483.1 NinE family protein [Pantoea sp.]